MSSWADFSSSIAELGTAGANAYATVKNGKAGAPQTAAPEERPAWMIPAAIGGGLLLRVLVFLGTRK